MIKLFHQDLYGFTQSPLRTTLHGLKFKKNLFSERKMIRKNWDMLNSDGDVHVCDARDGSLVFNCRAYNKAKNNYEIAVKKNVPSKFPFLRLRSGWTGVCSVVIVEPKSPLQGDRGFTSCYSWCFPCDFYVMRMTLLHSRVGDLNEGCFF